MSIMDKVAVVTGASRGIGKAIAIELGQQRKCKVIGTATTEAGAENISAYLVEAGIEGKGFCLNVADQESIENFCRSVQDDFASPANISE